MRYRYFATVLALFAACSGNGETAADPIDAAGDASSDAMRSKDTQTTRDGAHEEDAVVRDSTVQPPVDGAVGECDWRAQNGVVVIEAESLPLNESWMSASQSQFSGYSGTGYIFWSGTSHNNDPSNGVMQVRVALEEPGRYRLQWRNRIGIGTNGTEHNDTWVRFAGVDDYFGARGPSDAESRRYAKPQCEDASFMDGVRTLQTVSGATCAAGSTSDGWMKVYSSGATDWKWSTRTSDNDAHDIYFEVSAAGVITLELAARAEAHLIDRIVIHRSDISDSVALDLELGETRCQP